MGSCSAVPAADRGSARRQLGPSKRNPIKKKAQHTHHAALHTRVDELPERSKWQQRDRGCSRWRDCGTDVGSPVIVRIVRAAVRRGCLRAGSKHLQRGSNPWIATGQKMTGISIPSRRAHIEAPVRSCTPEEGTSALV